MAKPHHGRIAHWYKREYGDGYLIMGEFLDHPEFAGMFTNTSHVFSHDEKTGEIETRNSRYTLVGSECVLGRNS